MNEAGAGFCADLVRNHDFGRYASTLFLQPDQRRALLALYAFNVEILRVPDVVSQPLPGEVRLQWWTDLLSGKAHGEAQGNPIAAELLLAIRHFELPIEPLLRLVDEHHFDLYNDPMPTLAALEGYLTDTSAALFVLAAQITGAGSAEVDHLARHAGLAQGFAEVITSLPRAASRRQLFVPLQVLNKHGASAEDVFAGRQTPTNRAAVDELIGEARRHLDTALRLLGTVPPQSRSAFLLLGLVRRNLLRLSRADQDPFVLHVSSRLSTLWTLWRASKSFPFRVG